MSIINSLNDLLDTPGLPDNVRNMTIGLKTIHNDVELKKVDKNSLRQVWEGNNHNIESGRLLFPDLVNMERSIIEAAINNIDNATFKSNMNNILLDFDNWVKS